MPLVGAGNGKPTSISKLCALLLGVVFFIPTVVVEAQQQQKQALEQDAFLKADKGVPRLEATRLSTADHQSQKLETPHISERRKRTLSPNNNDSNNKNDVSAIATLAPVATAAVRAPAIPGQKSSETAGLSSPQSARSLDDWEVEDFVLLATVDGKLYARDRKTGQERWTVEADQPMVETTYYRRNRSLIEADYHRYDDYIWIVEPSRDGSLFYYDPRGPDPGLKSLGQTMKELVEEKSPWAGVNPPLLFTGEKKTTMVTLDARTGNVLKWFGSAGTMVKEESCSNSNGLLDPENDECRSSGTLTLGRVEYIVSIHDKDDGRQIATLKYAEWGPNNFDQDLHRQYRTTLDRKYIYSSHDGGIIGIDHSPSESAGKKFQQKFSSPVVRVFDVARPWGTKDEGPELIILPQPIPPINDEDILAAERYNRIFLNHTEDGSWYAMSGVTYPSAVTGRELAKGSNRDWWSQVPEDLSERELSKALVGLHSIATDVIEGEPRLTIGAPEQLYPAENLTEDLVPVDSDVSYVVSAVKSHAMKFILALWAFLTNLISIGCIIAFVTIGGSKIFNWSKALFHGDIPSLDIFPPPQEVDAGTKAVPELGAEPENNMELEETISSVIKIETTLPDALDHPAAIEAEAPSSINPVDRSVELLQSVASTIKPVDRPVKVLQSAAEIQAHDFAIGAESPQKEKKKAHRGRRGGVKHKKGGKSSSEDTLKSKPQPTIEEVVRDAQNLGQQPPLEADVQTINNGISEISGPILRMGNLVCNTDKLIGTGSNGTMVFEGEYDLRPVAVKRMLIQFFDIASHETKLLRESDDHSNVVRYHAQESRGGFLYIALELCDASLADIIERPSQHKNLAQAGEQDLPNVLYQIANGLSHLHALRIVHRDLKPQNILVAKPKGLGETKPRLLVSDFGLCKKLDREQSSFRATTAHAAGTTGWRAPELLLDEDNELQQIPTLDTSTHSGSGPIANGALTTPRRATRAIDIFSLGLVFFYVLTKGGHPFDCGDRFMREVNIRKGTFDLRPLEVLGDYSFEAKDLIASMLRPEPRERLPARKVMAHPFFWTAKRRLNFLCDVSDHFEKEPRDPPSTSLVELESYASRVCRGDFLKPLGKEFVDSMGKQRKYTGTRLLDLLRALRNKKNHYEDMSDQLKKHVGPLPDGYLSFWTRKFPNLLITCWTVISEVGWHEHDRFREYYQPAGL